jgi:uncharacterized membrane protein YgcG
MRSIRPPWRGASEVEGTAWQEDPDDPTTRLLKEYAAGPLSPDEAALDRMSATARRAFLEARLARTAAPVAAHARPRAHLRLAAAFSVALLVLASAGLAAAESGPGQPFYRTRLSVEAIFLPPAGTDERLAADLDRAQARLGEASRAAAAGDSNAEADAMGAYADVVSAMVVPDDEAARLELEQRLGQQLPELEALRGHASGKTAAELDRAIERVRQFLGGSGPQASPTPTGAGSGPSATPSHGAGSSSDSGPESTPSGGPGPGSSASPGGQGGGGQGSGGGGQGSGGGGGGQGTGGPSSS